MINLRSIDLNLLTVFEAVYEEKSQVKAAERLGMTQSAISLALGRLRYLVDDRLFQGRSKGLTPTVKADDLYLRIHQALNLIRDELSNKGAFEPATSQRTFVLALAYGGGGLFGPRLNALIQSKAPNIRLVIRTIDPVAELPSLLREHRVDLAIHHVPLVDQQLEQPIYDENQWVLIARGDHPSIQQDPSLDTLLAEQFVTAFDLLTHASEGTLGHMLEGVRERTKLEVPNALLLPHVVIQSDLLALVPEEMAARFIEIYPIQQFRLPVPVPPIRTHMIWHRSMTSDLGHRWFREQLELVKDYWKTPRE